VAEKQLFVFSVQFFELQRIPDKFTENASLELELAAASCV
jgi:hypothetical protein